MMKLHVDMLDFQLSPLCQVDELLIDLHERAEQFGLIRHDDDSRPAVIQTGLLVQEVRNHVPDKGVGHRRIQLAKTHRVQIRNTQNRFCFG